MIDLWYLNISEVGEGTFRRFLSTLPAEIRGEVDRYKMYKDKCLKLFARLIVKKYYLEHFNSFQWSDWSLSSNGKPYCGEATSFNISHSGNYVAVAFSEKSVGIDIEQKATFDYSSVSSFLHPGEVQYIDMETNTASAFYKVWTRKEAYLKAKGVGIVDGVNHENCLQPCIQDAANWFITSLDLIKGYDIAVCTQIPNSTIKQHRLEPTDFFEV